MTGQITIGYQGNGPVRIEAQLYRWRFTFLCLAWRRRELAVIWAAMLLGRAA